MTNETIGASWWGRRWVEALERLATAWQSRLPRGRDYAQKGHVISLAVASGRVSARVQGSRSRPYNTTIEVPTFRESDWNDLVKELAAEARFPAQLLVGSMPDDIEEPFQRRNLSLFPMRNSEMIGSCSCPDKARPCKHIAAVHYAFGEALDRDPFLLFKLRGADRDVLIRGFRRAWFDVDELGDEDETVLADVDVGEPVLHLLADRFNRSPEQVEQMSFTMRPPASSTLMLDRLGAPSSWQLPLGIHQLLGPVYGEAASRALDIALAETASAEAAADDEDATEAAETGADDGRFKTLDFAFDPIDAPATDAPAPDAFVLPESLASVLPKERPAPPVLAEAPAEESAPVLIRKGVAAISRRRRKGRNSGNLAAVTAETPAPQAAPTPPTEAPADMVEPKAKRRKGKKAEPEVQTIVRRRGRRVVAPTDDDAPSAPPPDLAPPTVRKRRAVEPAAAPEPAPKPPEPDAGPVVRRRGRRQVATATRAARPPTNDPAVLDARALSAWVERSDDDACLQAARDAWRAQPSEHRFRLLAAAAERTGSPWPVLAAEAELAVQSIPWDAAAVPVPYLLLLMAASRFDTLIELLDGVDARVWEDESEVGPLIATWALLATTAGHEPDADGPLSDVQEDLLDRPDDTLDRLDEPPAPTGAWLEWAVEDNAPDDATCERLFEILRETTGALVDARGIASSDRVASRAMRYVAATVEALGVAGREADARRFTGDMREAMGSRKRLSRAFEAALGRLPGA